jgi:hypothetical protein
MAGMDRDQSQNEVLLKADVERICRTLAGYGVLSHDVLCREAGGDHWSYGRFQVALRQAVRHGRVTDLGQGLYELSGSERA